jgi:endonuclease/exonuclease/phosphatase family metal-dependent hydrolase
VALTLLTWNLKHGRSVPGSGRDLLADFTAALASWEWDVALLQEVPPWWPARLAAALGGEARMVLTSRNAALPLRRWLARRAPDLIGSSGGGANAILSRSLALGEQRTQRLCLWPERRRMHAVPLLNDGVWIANLHVSTHPVRAQREALQAAAALRTWTGGAPAVLGGDFNVRRLALPGYEPLAAHGVDYLFAAGFGHGGSVALPDRGRLSDHAPLIVSVG